MTLDELESCEHPKQITKTCRELVKFLYPDVNQRSTMSISSMSKEQVNAIREYARLAHPNQSQTSNFILNNAIGNIFSSERHKQKKENETKKKHELKHVEQQEEKIFRFFFFMQMCLSLYIYHMEIVYFAHICSM
ncbi:unnamed protein product [Rotaria sordida]|uniref:Uncharacterized protein n=1 Tax=Rotaria sordida TaxID=392033 RepID=A0A815GAJ9_9BILA|nr:unnamed protein product [Rotaria sordida]CAF1594772.1 unnamed protein product [Rotaria sordida]